MRKSIKFGDDMPIVSITVAANILGMHPRTLMLYEYERILIPKRTKTKRRMYSQNDIKKVRFIQYLIRKKRLNYAGIRMVFSMMEKGEKEGIDFRSSMFKDYKE